MLTEKSFRRLPLRELLTDAEKRTRDLAEHVHVTWLARVSDMRELSRPVRKRSHFPTLLALLNALQKLEETHDETLRMMDSFSHSPDRSAVYAAWWTCRERRSR
jgi:hypothetical protein